jgi:SAM-dependent methyltransferase
VSEPDRIRERYARRAQHPTQLYSPLSPAYLLAIQDRERAIVKLINGSGLAPLSGRRLLDVGCGSGYTLLDMIGLGFAPENLTGCELLEDRVRCAKHVLPQSSTVVAGDATTLDLPDASFDIVSQFTVFTSILCPAAQQALASRMWSLVKPSGGVLWYDFIYNNPSNPDVRGIPVRRIRALFPDGKLQCCRVTLAPPLGRRVAQWPMLYSALDAIPILRTHVLCWISKEGLAP